MAWQSAPSVVFASQMMQEMEELSTKQDISGRLPATTHNYQQANHHRGGRDYGSGRNQGGL